MQYVHNFSRATAKNGVYFREVGNAETASTQIHCEAATWSLLLEDNL
jgi:hypothetical protein